MAPARTRKRKSSLAIEPSARPQTVALKSPTRTPVHSPQSRVFGITKAQKQALMDNLQLEVTERARKLRAQYALQAQSLRTRIELRINRIPTSLRKVNMGELQEKYRALVEEKENAQGEEPRAVETANGLTKTNNSVVVANDDMPKEAPRSGGRKRTSEVMESADKENTVGPVPDISNPKKRTKVTKGPSRQVTNPSTILSPKSANSRTFPQSPVRPALCSPQKPYLSHPASPLKHFSPIKIVSPAKVATAAATASLASMVGEKSKAGRPKAGTTRKASNPNTTKVGNTRAKRGAGPAHEPEDVRKASNTSNLSSVSVAMTIVNNAKKAPTAASRKRDVGVRAVGKKVAAGTEAPAPARRILRKRA